MADLKLVTLTLFDMGGAHGPPSDKIGRNKKMILVMHVS
jgi:hypothetical protein